MARVEAQDSPSVSVSGAPPSDYEQVSTSPNTFGAGVGQAVEKVGGEIGHIGQVWGQIQTDGAINQAMSQVDDHLNQYRTLREGDALSGRADTEKAIDAAFAQGRSGLKLPEQQLQYDQAVRSYRARYVNGIIASHADQQAKAYAQSTNKASFNQALTGAANVADDDDHIEMFRADARSALVKQVIADGNGSDPAAVQDALRRADQAVYKTQIEAIGAKDPEGALNLAEKRKDNLGLVYHQMIGELRSRATQAGGQRIAANAFGEVGSNIAGAVAPDPAPAIRQAILEQESGNRPNAPTSVAGAVGPGQIMPDTFKQYAKPGEDIANPNDNRAVSGRILDDLSKRYDGDPARVAVAYFSGPGNVAPAGAAQPWLVDKADGTGKKVSDYVSDVTTRVSQKGALLAAKASVYDNVMAATEGRPDLRQVALTEIDRKYRAAETASLATDKAMADQRNGALRQYGDSIRSGSAAMPWRNDPRLTEEQVEHLDNLQRTTISEGLNGKPGDYGPGYGSVLSRIYSTAGGDRIINPEQLLPLTSGPNPALNPAGYHAALKELDEINKPHAEGDRTLLSNFWSSARHAVTLEAEGMKDVIPGSGDKWNKALPVLTQALAQGKAKGLTLEQMLAPPPEAGKPGGSKDSIWPVLKPWLPTQSEKQAAEAFKDDQHAGEVANWQALTDKDEALRLYNQEPKGTRLTREHAMILAERNGWYKGQPGVAPAVPTGGP